MTIFEALRERYSNKRQWVFIEECPVGTGYQCKNFLDAFAISCFESEKNRRICFEVKVSRSDFLSEMKKPNKRRMGLIMSNEFYFVTPKAMLKIEEIPIECGLMEFDGERLEISLRAPHRESIRPSWNMVTSLLRKVGK